MFFIRICDCIPHPRSLWVGWRCQLHLFDGESRVDGSCASPAVWIGRWCDSSAASLRKFPSREMARGAWPHGAAGVGTYENFAYGCTIGMFFWTRWAALSHGCCFTPLHAFADNGRLQSYKLVIAICAHGEQSSSSWVGCRWGFYGVRDDMFYGWWWLCHYLCKNSSWGWSWALE